MGYWGVVNNCIKNADMILLLIDARLPEKTINQEVVKKAQLKGKKILYVFNKSDLISKGEIKRLNEKYTDSFFVSAKKRSTVYPLRKFLDNEGEGREKSLRIALIGYPNVGKSSLFNILIPEARAKVATVSGTTKKTEWIRSKNLRFMDSPGVIPRSDSKVQIGITASKDPHKIKDPEKVAIEIIRILRNKNEQIIEKYYSVKPNKDDSDYDIFLKIGEKKKMLIKGGEVDEIRTAIKIIEDWQRGRIEFK